MRRLVEINNRGTASMPDVISLERFTERDEYGTVYTASLQIVFYADERLSAISDGAIACYRSFVQRFRGQLTWYLAESMRNVREFSVRYEAIFPSLCADPDAQGLPAYRLSSGAGLQDFVPPSFSTGCYDTFSWLQLHLPPDFARDWMELLPFLAELAGHFRFRCGHVGLSLCWNEVSVDRDAKVPPLIAPLLKRYPGFSLGTPRELCDQPLPPVNWLTLLGPRLVARTGGVETLRHALADDQIWVSELGGGFCIRAGERPELGDVNRRENLPLYRKVGAFLKDYRGDSEIELSGLDEEESEAWLARFDS